MIRIEHSKNIMINYSGKYLDIAISPDMEIDIIRKR